MTTGCLFAVPTDAGLNRISPGAYFVEQRDDKLFALSLARIEITDMDQTAAEDWLPVAELAGWYEGPGVYVLSDDMQWAHPQSSTTATLDEVIQLNDAPPPPPQ
jgi:hypothetical protein